MRPYFHKVIVAPFDGITRKTTFVLRPKTQNLHSFSLFYLSSNDVIAHCTSNMVGTSIPYVKWDAFNSYQIIVPLDKILEKFQKITGPMIETLIKNFYEIKALTKTHDTLLPKLMSGEIRV